MLIARGVGSKSLLRANRRRGPLPTLHLVLIERQRIKVTVVCSVSQHCTRGVLQRTRERDVCRCSPQQRRLHVTKRVATRTALHRTLAEIGRSTD
jgi:hypothetical protein